HAPDRALLSFPTRRSSDLEIGLGAEGRRDARGALLRSGAAAVSRHLNLWKHNLGAVPDEVWDDEELETLVLADNGLTAISEKLGDRKSTRLNSSHVAISYA